MARQSQLIGIPAFLLLLGGTVLNETMPLLLGSASVARLDWSFPYVTMKFIVLPGISLVVLGVLLYRALRGAHVSWQAAVAGLTALAYLVSIALWPVPWLSQRRACDECLETYKCAGVAGPPNKELKLTKPGQLRSFAA